MRNKIVIYISLLLVGFVGTFIDWFLWMSGQPVFNINIFIQVVLVIGLTMLWQSADAKDRGAKTSSLSRVMTVLFAPVGSAIYLYKSREWKTATAIFAAFWGGLILSVIGAHYTGNWLATSIIFNES